MDWLWSWERHLNEDTTAFFAVYPIMGMGGAGVGVKDIVVAHLCERSSALNCFDSLSLDMHFGSWKPGFTSILQGLSKRLFGCVC